MTTQTSMSRCSRGCSTGVAEGMNRSATPCCCRPARFLLLQENGYLVLRFLAEDVGKELEMVLDAVLRVLEQRGRIAVPAKLNFVTGGRP